MKTLRAQKEFVVGKHNIGWISRDFIDRIGGGWFNPSKMPPIQTLERAMTDAEIESELKPGICTLGHLLALLDNPPTNYSWYLLYFQSCVVDVNWSSGDREWNVRTWNRDGRAWVAGNRVLSPATGSKNLVDGLSDSLTLESLDARLKTIEAFINPALLV